MNFNKQKRTRIDVHTHYLPPAYYALLERRNLHFLDGGIPCPEWGVEGQLENMEKLSISQAWLSVSSPHLHMGDSAEAVETARGCNEFGASLVKAYPEKFRIMASLPLPEIEASVREIRYCYETLHIRGFSLMTNSNGVYLGNLQFDPVMEELNRIKAVVSLHPTQPGAVPAGVCDWLPLPLMEFFFDTSRTVVNMILNRIFQRYTDIRFIIPHAGAVLPILSDRLKGLPALLPDFQQIDVAGSLAGLYYDLAGMAMPKQYDLLLKTTSVEHLLYGSDGTFTPISLCTQLAQQMDEALVDETAFKIYQENPATLLAR